MRKGLLPTENSNNIVNKEDIKEYFEKVINKYDMLNILDIKKYSDDQLRRIIKIQSLHKSKKHIDNSYKKC